MKILILFILVAAKIATAQAPYRVVSDWMKVVSANPWTPASLTNSLAFWYVADIGAFQDSGTTPCSNGTTVEQWNDQGSGGVTQTQATSGKRPTWVAGTINGHSSIHWNGANSTALSSSSTFTMNYVHSLFVVCSNTTANPLFIEYGTNSSDSLGDWYFYGASISMWYYYVSSATFYANGVANWQGTGWSLISIVYDGTNNATVYKNGVIQANGAVTGTPKTGTATRQLNLNNRNNTSLFQTGDIAELICYNGYVSSNDQVTVTNYLRAKYALP